MSDTPRTDLKQFASIPDKGSGSRFVVEAEVASQLERELAEANRDKLQLQFALEQSETFSRQHIRQYVNRCPHEWYQGRCIHCDVAAKDGKPAI